MEITCYRDPVFASEHRYLPAEVYNLATTMLARDPAGQLFVPIRSMPHSTLSPGFSNTFGSRKIPTPAGVPVAMMSPASSVIA